MNEAKVFPLEDVLIALRVRPDTATSYGVTMLGPLVKAQLVAFLTKKVSLPRRYACSADASADLALPSCSNRQRLSAVSRLCMAR
jgi:hypothetical protein